VTQIGPFSEENPPSRAQMWQLRMELVRRRVRRAMERDREREERETLERFVREFKERGEL
jgi:hypothetical protein